LTEHEDLYILPHRTL